MARKTYAKPTKAEGYLGPHEGQAYSYGKAGTPMARKRKYHGLFGTPESHEEFRHWKAEEELGVDINEAPLVIPEGFERWKTWVIAEHIYEKHGHLTSTIEGFENAMTWFYPLYTGTLIRDFQPRHLGIIIQKMTKAGLAEQSIKSYLSRIKNLWGWFLEFGLCTQDNFLAIQAVVSRNRGVKRDRVVSVNAATVRATLPHLNKPQRAMVELMCWSAARKGEIIPMQTRDIRDEHPILPEEYSGKCWVYEPFEHKTERLGGPRKRIYLGPQAIAVLEPWLSYTEPKKYIFSPYEAKVASLRQRLTKHGRRKGKCLGATLDKNRCYCDSNLNKAIHAACDLAGVPRWHPHQLRHLACTNLAVAFGLEATCTLMGHSPNKNYAQTRQYLDPDILLPEDKEKAARAIAAIVKYAALATDD